VRGSNPFSCFVNSIIAILHVRDTAMATVQKNNKMSVKVYTQEYKGKDYLHVREHYTTPDGDLKPTHKGVSVELALAEDLLQALAQVVGTVRNSPEKAQAMDEGLKLALAAIPPKA
jgi:hypothetical protein